MGPISRPRAQEVPSEGNDGKAAPSLKAAAVAYARRGILVFPCEAQGKRPLTPNGFWEATTT